MLTFFRLIRITNLLILALSLVLVQYFLVMPFLKIYSLEFSIDVVMFWCVTISAVLMMAGGFVINDYYDVETDSINKPSQNFIGTVYNKSQALNLYMI